MSRGFEIHAVRRFGDEPTRRGPEWDRFLAEAPLGDVFVDDAGIEAVALHPLTLVLSLRAGEALARDFGPNPEARFVAVLDGHRLFAGRIMFVGTARALSHPVIHVSDDGFATTVRILPELGARDDSEVTAPAALVEHFRARLLPAGETAAPIARSRRWMAEATSTKPGDPASRIEAECGDTCTLRLRFRMPGSPEGTWDQHEELALERADFDAVWRIVERARLAKVEPRPATAPAPRPIHPTRWRWQFALERATGETVEVDRSWESPSTADMYGAEFFLAAATLAQRLARTVPVRYFPGAG